MRESKFVEQNEAKWSEFEKELSKAQKDPEQLRNQLIQVTDDLSYAKTFYKNRSVRVYLNGLAQKIFINIYKNKRNFGKSFIQFFKEEVPLISWNSRKVILLVFLLLVFCVIIGAFSSAKDEQFARSILSDAYVDQTIENIKKGDPMGVYKQSEPFAMFLYIAKNNLMVSFFVFIFGIFAGYGSIIMLVRNGIMLGVFMYFFYSRGQVAEFNYAVWLHGTIEILTIVICTVSGMLLGRGLIYPGTLSRYKAFSIWGKRGAMLYLSTIPFIIFAAFIESFLTRFTDMPNIIRLAIILGSLGLMLFYFVIYPYFKFKNSKDDFYGIPELKEDSDWTFDKLVVYNNGQIFLKTIHIISENFSKIMRYIFGWCAGYLGLLTVFNLKNSIQKFELVQLDSISAGVGLVFGNVKQFFKLYENVSLFFNENETLPMYFLSSAWLGVCCFLSFYLLKKYFLATHLVWYKSIFICLLFALGINLLMLSNSPLMVLLYIFISPVVLFLMAHFHFKIFNDSVSQIFKYSIANYGRLLGILLLFLLVSFLAFLFLVSSFSFMVIQFMEINVSMSDATYTLTLQFLLFFGFVFVLSFCIFFYIFQIVLTSYTVKEISTAEGLIKGIENIGKVNKSYGIETE